MTRKVTAKAQSSDSKVEITVKIETKDLMQYEVKRKVDTVKNDVYDMLRLQGFNHSEIKIS